MRLYITLIISAFYGCTTSEIQTASFAVGIGDKLLSTPEAEISPPLFAISPEPFSSAHVAVADDGQYLIAYQDRRGDDSGWRAGDNVRVARMAKNGRLLDRGGIEIAFSGPSRQQVFVASDGVDYLVAWVRTTDYEESKIVFARLGHDGRVLQGPTDVRAVKNVEHIAPQVCFDGHDYAMVFGALDNAAWRGSVHAARISKQGRVLSVSELPTTAGKEGARVAIACRKGSLIAWSESDLDSTVLRMLAWPQQQPLPKTSNALSLSSVRQTGWIGLAAGASNFLAVWDEAYTKGGKWSLVGQVVTPAAKRTTPTNRQLSGGQPTRHHPELQYDSKAYRLLMQRLVNNQEQVFAASLDETGVVIEPAKQLTDGDRHYPRGLACHNGTCLAAWTTGPILRYFAAATRLDQKNVQIDKPALLLATPSDDQTQLRVTKSGKQLLYAWSREIGRDNIEVVTRRQDLAGKWLDSAPVPLRINNEGVSGAFHSTALPGGGFALVVTTPVKGSSTDRVTHFATISPTGQVSSKVISHRDHDVRSLVCGPSECLVTFWGYFKTYAHRLDHQGALQTPDPVVFDCAGGLHLVGHAYWCVTPTTSPVNGQTITRFDRTLASVGTPLVIPFPDVDIGGAMLHQTSGAITLFFSAADTSAAKLVAARVNLAGDTILSAPKELVRYTATAFSRSDLSPSRSCRSARKPTFSGRRPTEGGSTRSACASSIQS
jgi:hypothetical protein